MGQNILTEAGPNKLSWDKDKSEVNLKRHKIGFDTACHIFEDPFCLEEWDRVKDGEDRWEALGKVGNGPIVRVNYTVRRSEKNEVIRIITARKADKNEREKYEKGRARRCGYKITPPTH